MFEPILAQYGIDESDFTVKSYGNGLINHTWKIIAAGKEFLLQRINHQIFKRPVDIMDNCSRLSGYFKMNHPDYLFISPLLNKKQQNYLYDAENNCYRLFPFVKNSYSCNTVSKCALAYEAAKQFGKFTKLLSGFDTAQLHITLPDFHNLSLRQQQYEHAIQYGNEKRIAESAESIIFLKEQKGIVETFERIKRSSSFPTRVIHHDAKINNVLFDVGTDQGLCVIDLDTVMPGYYISDVGDMLRTYLSPAGEEDAAYGHIGVREDFFREIAKGYLEEMQSELTEEEKQYFVYAGKFAIYMQAIRFLADYLNNDTYYSIRYEKQNLIRANNQVELLKRFIEKENRLEQILKSIPPVRKPS
jgi:thiamine kinase-like enzyme